MLNTLTKTLLELQDLQAITPDLEKVKILPQSTSQQIQTVIFDWEKNQLSLLTTNNIPAGTKQLVDNLTAKGYKVTQYYTDWASFDQIVNGWYEKINISQQEAKKAFEEKQNAEWTNAESMIQKIFNERSTMDDGDFIMELIRLTFQAGASDLHFQPEAKGIFMKMRKDGILKQILSFQTDDFARYLQKLKFISWVRMNIDYLPQDGRFSFEVNINNKPKTIDVRVNFMPGLRAESIVMRFLDSSKGIASFTQIGYTRDNLQQIQKHLTDTYGMVLVTGPTGSGKTTTLYSMLNALNTGEKKIITLEDPIEYELDGIQQSQMNFKKGYTYEEGLKAILRHDPDVILVWEIRTLDTAEIALNAALTGHLVFSTLHTNSAVETISRMINLGVQGYMLAPALNLIIGQRLVRKLCHCAVKKPASFAEQEEVKQYIEKINAVQPTLNLQFDGQLPHPVGCQDCNGDGYQGRIAIVETLEITEDLKNGIIAGKNALDIYAKARETGFITMKEDGVIKILEELTTLEELRRVL